MTLAIDAHHHAGHDAENDADHPPFTTPRTPPPPPRRGLDGGSRRRPEEVTPFGRHPRLISTSEVHAEGLDDTGDPAVHLLDATAPVVVGRDNDGPPPLQRTCLGNQYVTVAQGGDVSGELRTQLSAEDEIPAESRVTRIIRTLDLDTGDVEIRRVNLTPQGPTQSVSGETVVQEPAARAYADPVSGDAAFDHCGLGRPQPARRTIRDRLSGAAQGTGRAAPAARGAAGAAGARARGAAAAGLEGVAGGLENIESGRAQTSAVTQAQQQVQEARQGLTQEVQAQREANRPQSFAARLRAQAAGVRGDELTPLEKTASQQRAEQRLQEAEQSLAELRANAGTGFAQRLGSLTAGRQQPAQAAQPGRKTAQTGQAKQAGGFNLQALLKAISAGADTPARQPKSTGPKIPKGGRGNKKSGKQATVNQRGGQATITLNLEQPKKDAAKAPAATRRRADDDWWRT